MNVTYNLIMSLNLGYDPHKDLCMPKDYSASVEDFVAEYRDKVSDLSNILLVLLREEFFSHKDLRLFALWCAQQVMHLMKDQRSLDALIIAEKFAFGDATEDELLAARREACSAFCDYFFEGSAFCAVAAVYSDDISDAAYGMVWADAVYSDDAKAGIQNSQIDKLLEILHKPDGKWFVRT